MTFQYIYGLFFMTFQIMTIVFPFISKERAEKGSLANLKQALLSEEQ